jgi:hypothetical protein
MKSRKAGGLTSGNDNSHSAVVISARKHLAKLDIQPKREATMTMTKEEAIRKLKTAYTCEELTN